MKRKPYFPRIISERPEWFHNFATQLPQANTVLGLDPAVVSARVADALYCEYVCGPWLTWARDCGPAATAAVDTLFEGSGAGNYALPVFNPPPLPPGDPAATPPIPATVAVPAGALRRIQDFVVQIKREGTYTEELGKTLGIVGEADSVEKEVPEFTLKVERADGGACECVRISFKKYGYVGVAIWSQRDPDEWEKLGLDYFTPYLDQRPLKVPGQPEVRKYRLQFVGEEGPTGPFTPIQSVTVSA